MKKNKFSPSALGLMTLGVISTYIAIAFSIQGFLTLGSDLTANIDTWPMLGWGIQIIKEIPSGRLVGFAVGGFLIFKCIKAKGISKPHAIALMFCALLIGGAETFNNNVGAIVGGTLFLWFNFVQLSSLVGRLAGFHPTWGRELKPYIAGFYIAEFLINLWRFPPYADGRASTFLMDAADGVLDGDLIRWQNLAWMIVSVIAVEATAVFFIKCCKAAQNSVDKSVPSRPHGKSAPANPMPRGGF